MLPNIMNGAARLLPGGAVGQIVLTLQASGNVNIETGFDPPMTNMILDKVKAHLVNATRVGPALPPAMPQ